MPGDRDAGASGGGGFDMFLQLEGLGDVNLGPDVVEVALFRQSAQGLPRLLNMPVTATGCPFRI